MRGVQQVLRMAWRCWAFPHPSRCSAGREKECGIFCSDTYRSDTNARLGTTEHRPWRDRDAGIHAGRDLGACEGHSIRTISEQLGFRLMLNNAYHLYLRPGHKVVAEMGGLHRFTGLARRHPHGQRRISNFQSGEALQGDG